jgi:hypothetical protein
VFKLNHEICCVFKHDHDTIYIWICLSATMFHVNVF